MQLLIFLLLSLFSGTIGAAQMRLTQSTQSKKKVDESLNDAMREAVNKHDFAVLEYLFAEDTIPDVNARNIEEDVTPIMSASFKGRIDIVKLLINCGADVNARSYYGWTPLMWAEWHGYTNVVKLLIAAGADVNAQDNSGDTALMRAVSNYQDVVELLIRHNAHVNAKNKSGETALMRAALWNRINVIKLLVAEGADDTIKDKQGRSALDYAKNKSAIAKAIEEGKKERAAYLKQAQEVIAQETELIPELTNIVRSYAYGPLTTDLPENKKFCIIQ